MIGDFMNPQCFGWGWRCRMSSARGDQELLIQRKHDWSKHFARFPLKVSWVKGTTMRFLGLWMFSRLFACFAPFDADWRFFIFVWISRRELVAATILWDSFEDWIVAKIVLYNSSSFNGMVRIVILCNKCICSFAQWYVVVVHNSASWFAREFTLFHHLIIYCDTVTVGSRKTSQRVEGNYSQYISMLVLKLMFLKSHSKRNVTPWNWGSHSTTESDRITIPHKLPS